MSRSCLQCGPCVRPRLIGLTLLVCMTVGSRIGTAEEPAIAEASVPPTSATERSSPEALVSPKALVSPEQLDQLFLAATKLNEADLAGVVTDEQFLRRVSLDLIGRQPTPDELAVFLLDGSEAKRAAVVERLLGSPEFGSNWASYWSDVIGYRVPPPELTFLDYTLFEQWLADRINKNAPWDETVRTILMASGKIKDHPEATFVGFHEADTTRLAAETARVFLSLQIGCAQCHDHPFDEWKREQFHELAAYFVRASAKMPWNDSGEIEVKDKGKGEYQMPNVADPSKKGITMVPAFLTGAKLEIGKNDLERRTELAMVIARNDNPWFAKAYVNRVWARLMGRGFHEPVDDIGAGNEPQLREVHTPLTAHFIATGFDAKSLFRLIVNSRTYQLSLSHSPSSAEVAFAAGRTTKLRGDEVFQSLVTAINLPNVTPPKTAPTKDIRFPPPPKSTKDIVSEIFGFDPSLRPEDISRTLNQAMLMMNNDQLQAQFNANPESGTTLSKLVSADPDNAKAINRLFQLVLARNPTGAETTIALEHVSSLSNRGEAFEDLLWSLINSTEFTTKR